MGIGGQLAVVYLALISQGNPFYVGSEAEQISVVIAGTEAQTIAEGVKGNAGYDSQINFFRRDELPGGRRQLGDAVMVGHQLLKGWKQAHFHQAVLRHTDGQEHVFLLLPALCIDDGSGHFILEGLIQHHSMAVLPQGQGEKTIGDLLTVLLYLLGRQLGAELLISAAKLIFHRLHSFPAGFF